MDRPHLTMLVDSDAWNNLKVKNPSCLMMKFLLMMTCMWTTLSMNLIPEHHENFEHDNRNHGLDSELEGSEDFLLLRSKSFNTVSQSEVTGFDSYTISDVARGSKFIDWSIQTSRVNLTSFPKGSYSHKFQNTPVLVMKTFFSGRVEKRRKIAILTNETLDIYDMSLKETIEAEDPSRWRCNTSILNELIAECRGGSASNCQFVNILHKANDTRDLYFIEVKVSGPVGSAAKPRWKLVLLSEDSSGDNKDRRTEAFDLPTVRLDPADPASPECLASETLVIRLPRNSSFLAVFGRYCSVARGEQESNAVHFGAIVQDEFGNKVYQSLGTFQQIEVANSGAEEKLPVRLLRLQMSNDFLIMATREGFWYNNWATLEDTILKGSTSSEPRSLKMYLLHAQPMSAVFCNFLNLFELCCTVGWVPPGRSAMQLRVVELVNLETNVVVANLPLEINMMSADNRVLDSLNTKNYLIVRAEEGMWACSRKGLIVQNITSDPTPPNGTYCAKIEMEDGSKVVGIKELLFEENFSNVIDGYVLVALSSPEDPKTLIAKPLLITGPYFIFSTDLRLDSYVCERYLPNCGETAMEFLNGEFSHGKIKKRVFLIDDAFNSIIYVTPNKIMDSYLANGKFYFDMDEYMYGDIQEPTISRSIAINAKNLMIPRANDSFYATVNRFFTISVPEFYPMIKNAKDVVKKWAYLRFNRDGTITAAICKDSNLESPRGTLPSRTIVMTKPNLPLSYNDSDFSKTYASTVLESSAFSNQTVLQAISEARDSIDLLDWRVARNQTSGEYYLQLKIKRFDGQGFELKDICKFELDLLPGERFSQVRSQVYLENNFVIILTDKRIIITQVVFDKESHIETKIEMQTSTIAVTQSSVIRVEPRDILIVENILLIDLEFFYKSGGSSNSIVLYNFDFKKRYLYCYGTIKLPAGSLPGDYQLYYSKTVDKAVLVLYAQQIMVEYSLDNVFFNLTNIGKELQPDCSVSLKSYGPHEIRKFLLPDFRQNNSESRRQMKTILTPFNDRFPVLALVEGAKDKILVLMIEIGSRVLSNFKSHWLEWREGDWIAMPTVVQEGFNNRVLPLIMVNNKTGDLKLTFLSLKTTLELNYRNIFGNSALKLSDEQDKNPNLDQHLKLTLRFRDPEGRAYEENFKVERDSRFLLSESGLQQGDRAYGFEVVNTPLDQFGMVSSIGIECPEGETSGIYRNMSRHIFCRASHFNCSFQNSMNRELVADFRSPTKWNITRDFMRTTDVLENTYMLLSDDRIYFFEAKAKVLRYLLIMSAPAKDLDINKCSTFRGSELKQLSDGSSVIAVNVYCTDSLSAYDVEIHIDSKILKTALESHSPIEVNLRGMFYKNKIEDKIWRTVSESNRDFETLDDVFVVGSEMNLLSIGKKKFLDFYFIKYDNRQEPKGLRYVLVNSTLNDKYSESALLNFRLVRPLASSPSDSPPKRYQLVQLTWVDKQQSIEVIFALLEVSGPQEVRLRLQTSVRHPLPSANEKYSILHGDLRISDDDMANLVGISEFAISRNYSFYFITNNDVYEFTIEESYDGISAEPSFQTILSPNSSNPFTRYNYAGLCDTSSKFNLVGWRSYLLLTCLPPISDPTEESFLVVYKRAAAELTRTVNPLHTLQLSVGHSTTTNFYEIFAGEDGFPRLLKTSASFLLEQYILYPSSRLVFFVEPNQGSQLQLGLHVGNNYELKRIGVSFNADHWIHVGNFFIRIRQEVGFWFVNFGYGIILFFIWMAIKQRTYARSLDSKSPKLPAQKISDQLSDPVGTPDRNSLEGPSSATGSSFNSHPSYESVQRAGFLERIFSRAPASDSEDSAHLTRNFIYEVCV